MEYFIDYETKSELDLTKVGTMRYVMHPSTDIVFMTWGTYKQPAQLWMPGAPPPFTLKPEDKVYAFNAQFDRLVQNRIGCKYGLQEIPITQCIDLQAVCARLALPQNLDSVCQVLKLENKKLTKRGKQLMSKICSPPYKYTRQEFLEFVQYGLTDTNAIIELAQKLPVSRLSANEQRCWERTARMNERGVEIDLRMAIQVAKCVDLYKAKRNRYLNQITEGAIKTGGQTKVIRKWLAKHGLDLPDLRKRTVLDALDDETLDLICRRVLEVRLDVASTAVQKFTKVQQLAFKRVLYMMLVYHAASPGRYSSRGLQIHNLLRAKVDNPDEVIASFFNGKVFETNVVETAKTIIRSMIRARHGKAFIISDFSSIEYVVCCWLAGDLYHLLEFAKKVCPYKTLAADLLHKPYEDVTKDERQMGKPGVLGGIYGLGAGGYIEYARGYGIKVTHQQATITIDTLRRNYPKIKTMWYKLQTVVLNAIWNPGTEYRYRKIRTIVVRDRVGTKWLKIILPSGRPLYYYDPKIGEGKYGEVATHMGVDSKTHQWVRKELTPSRITENVTQATARDLLVYCENCIEDEAARYNHAFEQVFSCHDETVTECNITLLDQIKTLIDKIQSTPPAWCKDLPLLADTTTSKRYKKG